MMTNFLTGFLLATFTLSTSAQINAPVISEFMANNSDTLSLGDGSAPDWIEIHNSSATDLVLTGWHLTDDLEDLTKWTFPLNTYL